MSTPLAVIPSASTDDWLWSAFWLALPFVVLCLVLAVVTVVALLRARPEDVPRVFSTFGSSLAQLARWLPRQRISEEKQLDPTVPGGDDENLAAVEPSESAL